jgi:ribonuclease HI
MATMEIFTDGSCLNNRLSKKGLSKGGVGVFFGDNDPRNISEPLAGPKVTNQVAELTAISRALDVLIAENYNGIAYIYSDSKYSISIFTEWIKTWEKNNWRRAAGEIENLELIKEIQAKLKRQPVIFKHVRSHRAEPPKDDPAHRLWHGNNQADLLATRGSSAQ